MSAWVQSLSPKCPGACVMSWIREIDATQTFDDLKTFPSIAGNQYPNFEMLDSRVATALKRILTNTNLKNMVFLEVPSTRREGDGKSNS